MRQPPAFSNPRLLLVAASVVWMVIFLVAWTVRTFSVAAGHG